MSKSASTLAGRGTDMGDEKHVEQDVDFMLDFNDDGKFTVDDLLWKLTSRKFWMSVATLVFLIMVYVGADEDSATQVVSIIMAAATAVGYMVGEGLSDKGSPVGDVTLPGVVYPEYEVKSKEE